MNSAWYRDMHFTHNIHTNNNKSTTVTARRLCHDQFSMRATKHIYAKKQTENHSYEIWTRLKAKVA